MLDSRVFKIFVDFDGTITQTDIGEGLFFEFGDKDFCKKIFEDWSNGLVDPRTGWKTVFESVGNIDAEKINNYLDKIEIDPTFKDFVQYSYENGFEIKIVSDGFDYYINRILQKEKLGDIPFTSNKMIISSDGRLIPSFPGYASDCKCSANCKRNFVLNNSSEEEFSIYIGDGSSDRCPVQYCDFIFAKKELLRFCEINRITYFPFTSFTDVIKKLDELKNKKRLKKRHQAELKRKEVYTQEA